MLILDEADEMLNKGAGKVVLPWYSNLLNSSFYAGFKEQIYDIYRFLPPSTQVRD